MLIVFGICPIFFINESYQFRIDPYPVDPKPDNFKPPGNPIPPPIPPYNGNGNQNQRPNPDPWNRDSDVDQRIKREWDSDRGGWIIPFP
uniref:Uncharacterized protein n=1 Tax=Panagrolaimus davidi TaxID=227884 RepID=A0A914PE50_9BILA